MRCDVTFTGNDLKSYTYAMASDTGAYSSPEKDEVSG